MALRRCMNCGQTFTPRPQVPSQAFCSSDACQRARRKAWLQTRLREDSDYRENRSRSQRAWLDRNPDYWQRYRERRAKEPAHDAKAMNLASADREAPPVGPGLYLLRVIAPPTRAKTDAWIVELTLV